MFKIKSEDGILVKKVSSSDVKIMRKKLKNITSLSDKGKTKGGMIGMLGKVTIISKA